MRTCRPVTSLYIRLGGFEAIRSAVDIFYSKVLDDPSLAPFFEGLDMTAMRAHQRAMLTAAFGGPNDYVGRGLAEAHAGLVERGLTDQHFDAVVRHLGATLTELGVAEELVTEAGRIAESVRDVVLNRSASAKSGSASN